MVQRRVGGNPLGGGSALGGVAASAKASPSASSAANRLKPSVKQTFESMVSTGSQAEYFKPDQTIILFDWDDTLCPSNWIRENRPATSFFQTCTYGREVSATIEGTAGSSRKGPRVGHEIGESRDCHKCDGPLGRNFVQKFSSTADASRPSIANHLCAIRF